MREIQFCQRRKVFAKEEADQRLRLWGWLGGGEITRRADHGEDISVDP